MQIGRKVLYTNVKEITSENVISVLTEALPYHMMNAERIRFLLEYDAGNQPLQRKEEKSYRPDIDCHYIDNVANEISEFKMGFHWGNPITFVQRGENDSGKKNSEPYSISLLNEQYEAAGIGSKTQELSRYVEICGVGYTFVDTNMEWEDGESFFRFEVLNPAFAFVVRSSYYIDRRIMLAVTFSQDENSGNRYFTCYSKDYRWEILNAVKIVRKKEVENWDHRDRSGEENPLHRIPIIEWIRSYDRMGCFERQISAMDNLNLMESDFMNDVEQNTQAIWHGNDVEFPKDSETGKEIRPKTNDWILTNTTPDGKTPFVKPLAVEYNYSGILEKIIHDRATILQNAFVPQGNDNSGGSTGIAQSYATGFTAAEMVAEKQQCIMETCKMEELKVVLAAIKESPYVPADSPLLDLRFSDVKPKIKRNRNYELSTKSNTLATLISHGVYGLHAIKTVSLFEDENQVWEDSKSLIEKYQSSLFDSRESDTSSSEKIEQDESDQISNSPLIDGISTDNTVD